MSSIRIDKILQENIKSVVLGKAFHVYKRRNEWVNWDGDTDLVNRSWASIYLSLREAEQYAEKSRTQGTKFVIDELPYIFALSESGAVAITELFSESPMLEPLLKHHLDENRRTISDLKNQIKNSKWVIKQIFEGDLKVQTSDSMYYRRTSSAGKQMNSLGWSLNMRKMNEDPIVKLVNEIKKMYL